MASSLFRREVLRHVGDLRLWSSVSCRQLLCRRSPAVLASGNTPVSLLSSFKGQPGSLAADHVSHMRAIVERGAYDERIHKHVTGSEVQSVDLLSDGKQLAIHWSDGKVSKFHSVWLRHSCFCPQCRMDHTGQIKVEFDKIPEPSRILSAVDDGEGCLTVQWKEEPGHTGVLPLRFLKANCYSKESLQQKRDSLRMTFSKDNVIPQLQYEDVMNSSQGLYRWMKALNQTGISIVNDVPCETGMVGKVCKRIADCLQHTIYGEIFDVKTVSRPINAAYAPVELKLHMDQPMYEAAPGLQALHCVKFDEDIKGGDNIFVDLFHVAETFREKHPEDFDILSRVPINMETIHYDREWPVHMRYHRHMFTLNQYGDLIGVVWHPHLMGPLEVEEEFVEPTYRALAKFYTLINNFPYQFRNRLSPGQLVIFNNRRVLHGRSAFDSHVGDRHLQGCYVEISEFKSRVHVLSNLVGDGAPPVRVGDYDYV
ncbi:hypothetical protein ACOMHN_051500 [Nucella lapillus]